MKVVDGDGGSWSVLVGIPNSPTNAPPVLLSNNPTLEPADAPGGVRRRIGATDADGDPLTYVLTSPPTQGTVIVSPDGSFVYTRTPGAGASTASVRAFSDSFAVTVSDGYGGLLKFPSPGQARFVRCSFLSNDKEW